MKGKRFLQIIASVFRTVFTCLLVLVVAIQVYVVAAKAIMKKDSVDVFGYRTAVVLTGSMSGSIEPGDLIVTRSSDSYAVGDVIMYETESGRSVTHRIITETADGFITKGDANNIEDSNPVKLQSILGKVVYVLPGFGAFLQFLTTPLGLLIVFAVLGILIFVPTLFEKKKKKNS